MSGLFLNPFIADNESSVLNRGNLLRHKKVQLSQKLKIFCNFFLGFLNLDSITRFSEKRWPYYMMYFWTYRLRKTWLDKCLQSFVLEDPSTSNMVNGPKSGSKLNKSNCTISINPCEDNSGLKSLSAWYGKP